MVGEGFEYDAVAAVFTGIEPDGVERVRPDNGDLVLQRRVALG